ncbi:thioredoxin [Sandarakinorhabdus oryzae]|uniref:thioredoxin n=1 Tax=Sandarakinorhabdus oryzae TaxID=2675220 RepID=UPI0012E1F8A8|nr:thioredoxin [Sandarakinorhabdus oryzae]
MASIPNPAAEKASIEAFRRDVIDASKTALVLVDFWAEWCGPCKTLGPMIERLVAARAPKVKLVKIDVDKNQALAAQFRIQSIPTVYAFLDGRPVDGFQGALPERELAQFIDRLLAGVPASDDEAALEEQIGQLVAAAEEATAAGAHDDAAAMLAALVQELPDRHDLVARYALALVAGDKTEAAAAALQVVPVDSKDELVTRARAALALAAEAPADDELSHLVAKVTTHPDDHAARFELAGALAARGERDGAAEHLLAIIKADRSWNEGAAREKLLTMFEAAGLADPWSVKTRAALRAIWFA